MILERLQNCTLTHTSKNGKLVTSSFRLEETEWANHWLIVSDDEKAIPIGVIEEACDFENIYLLGDRVKIESDVMGYITPGIRYPGLGEIVEIRRDIDHYYGVLMDDGEFGYVKSARIARILS